MNFLNNIFNIENKNKNKNKNNNETNPNLDKNENYSFEKILKYPCLLKDLNDIYEFCIKHQNNPADSDFWVTFITKFKEAYYKMGVFNEKTEYSHNNLSSSNNIVLNKLISIIPTTIYISTPKTSEIGPSGEELAKYYKNFQLEVNDKIQNTIEVKDKIIPVIKVRIRDENWNLTAFNYIEKDIELNKLYK